MKKSEELLDASGAIRIGIRVNPKNSSDISRAKLLLNDVYNIYIYIYIPFIYSLDNFYQIPECSQFPQV